MTNNERRIVFRADGDSNIGLGHMMRSLALAEILSQEFKIIFVTKSNSINIQNRVIAFCDEYKLIDHENEFLNLVGKNDIVVLDGYDFDFSYQRLLKSNVYKLVMLDDKANMPIAADLIINHGGDLVKRRYLKDQGLKLLAGFKYLLVRKEFLHAAKVTRAISKVDTAYICMGGADPLNITIKALQACIDTEFIRRIFVVSGSAYNNRAELSKLISKNKSTKQILHEEDIGAARMVQVIRESEIAIAPSSSVAMEVCCVKTGLLTGTVIDNQEQIHGQLVKAKCCISLGDFNIASVEDIKKIIKHLSSPSVVNKIIEKQTEAIDGLSGVRLLKEFRALAEITATT